MAVPMIAGRCGDLSGVCKYAGGRNAYGRKRAREIATHAGARSGNMMLDEPMAGWDMKTSTRSALNQAHLREIHHPDGRNTAASFANLPKSHL